MKVLVARPDSDRVTVKKGDFNSATPGEVLTLGSVCDGDAAHRRRCGCGRAFSGLDSAKATTFGIVTEMTEDDVRAVVAGSQFVKGWTLGDDSSEVIEGVMEDMQMLDRLLRKSAAGDEARVSQSPTQVKVSCTSSEMVEKAERFAAWRVEATEIIRAGWATCDDRDEVNVRINGTKSTAYDDFEAGVSAADFAHYLFTGEKKWKGAKV